jgi:hypothetical protein
MLRIAPEDIQMNVLSSIIRKESMLDVPVGDVIES